MGELYEDGCAIQGAPGGRKSTVARLVMVEAALQGKTSMIALLESNRTKFVHQMACMIANDLLYRWGYTYDATEVYVSIDSGMLRSYDRRLQSPIIQAALSATRSVYRALQPYWLVADRHDGVRDTRILTRKIYEGPSLRPDLSLLIVDNGNYGNVYDDQDREIHD